jgi:hypothetical protein
VIVTVNAATPMTDVADRTICSNETSVLDATTVGIVSYSWSPVTNLSSSTVANPTFGPAAAGSYTYTVTGENADGCFTTDQVIVTVAAAPTALFVTTTADAYENEKAVPFEVTFNALYTYTWSLINANGATIIGALNTESVLVDFGNPGAVTVRVEIELGSCIQTLEQIVTVRPTVKAKLRAFLEGAIDDVNPPATPMSALLNDVVADYRLSALFEDNTPEFDLSGFVPQTEEMAPGYTVPSNAVDVVKLTLRTTPSGADLFETFGWLLSDGRIVDFKTGLEDHVVFYAPTITNDDYHVVIRHRNHLPAMSLNAVALDNTVNPGLDVDFSSASDVYQIGAEIPGVGFNTTFGISYLYAGNVFNSLLSGDVNEINALDYLLVIDAAKLPVVQTYSVYDVTLDGAINAADVLKVSNNNDELFRSSFND